MSRTKEQELISKLFSSLQEIAYSNCRGLNINDKFFLDKPIMMNSITFKKMFLAYAVIDVNKRSVIPLIKGTYYGRIVLFEGGLVEVETKNKNFASYAQKISDDYRKATHHKAIYCYHH